MIVVGVKFYEKNLELYRKWSARTFVEINKEQTKVPSDLINLISYSAMGDLSPKSLSARLLIELNNVRLGPLSDVFQTRPFQKVNRVGGRPVRIGMVTDELQKLLNIDNKNDLASSNIYQSFSEAAWKDLSEGRAQKILEEGKAIVNKYFSHVEAIFTEDWSSHKSLIFSSKYIGAFCRLLVEFKRQNLDENQILSKLEELKNNIVNEVKVKEGNPVFLRSQQNRNVPQVGGANSASLARIFEWLKEHLDI